jgi:hypothetical protein
MQEAPTHRSHQATTDRTHPGPPTLAMTMRDDFPSPAELRGAVQGTLLYLGVYVFILIPFQIGTKFYVLGQKKREAKQKDNGNKVKVSYRAIKYYNSHDMLALAGDRTVGNFLEYAIVFLPLLWIHAVWIDPTPSFTICAAYSAARVIYPVAFLHGVPGRFLSSVPGYLILGYLFVKLASNV